MKHLFISLLLSASLTAFSQSTDTTQPFRQFDVSKWGHASTGIAVSADRFAKQPDTLRAIILVTMSPNGIAHARMGYVVIAPGKRPVYLDCRKRALKLPQVGWDFREVDPNRK